MRAGNAFLIGRLYQLDQLFPVLVMAGLDHERGDLFQACADAEARIQAHVVAKHPYTLVARREQIAVGLIGRIEGGGEGHVLSDGFVLRFHRGEIGVRVEEKGPRRSGERGGRKVMRGHLARSGGVDEAGFGFFMRAVVFAGFGELASDHQHFAVWKNVLGKKSERHATTY